MNKSVLFFVVIGLIAGGAEAGVFTNVDFEADLSLVPNPGDISYDAPTGWEYDRYYGYSVDPWLMNVSDIGGGGGGNVGVVFGTWNGEGAWHPVMAAYDLNGVEPGEYTLEVTAAATGGAGGGLYEIQLGWFEDPSNPWASYAEFARGWVDVSTARGVGTWTTTTWEFEVLPTDRGVGKNWYLWLRGKSYDDYVLIGGVKLSGGTPPDQASRPNPVDGATEVRRDAVLRWTPAEYVPTTNGHRVYLSESFDEVDNGLASADRGLTDDPAFDTGDLPFELNFGTTYYWRIDEYNPDAGWKRSDVWKFTTKPFDPFEAGPFVNFYDRGEVTVCWKTKIATTSVIEYGVKPDMGQTVADAVARTEHELTITNIRPQTQYSYRIVADGARSKVYEFYSAFDYGPGPFPPGDCPYPVDSLTPLYEQAAEHIINATGITKGVCIDYGCGRGRLAYEIAKRSDLKIIGFEQDPDKVAQARNYLDQADIYGVRVTVFDASLSSLDCREYSANLIVSDAMISQGVCPGSQAEMFRVLAPAGGVAFLGQPLGCPNPLDRADLENWLGAGDYVVTENRHGLWAKIERDAIPGAGEWTHYYADPTNSANSGETGIQNSMKMLWYGQPGPRYITDRHNRPMSPLCKNGIMITPGLHRLMAFDAYNGSRYWDLAIPEATRVAILRDCGWVALADDYAYVAHKDDCLALDVNTGRPALYLTTPTVGSEKLHWGYLAVDGDKVFGTGQVEHASLIGNSLAHVYESYYDHRPIATGRYLFAMDRHNGDLLWTYRRTQGSAVINPCIVIGGDYLYFIESRNPQAVNDPDGRVTGSVLTSGDNEYLVKLNKNTGAEVKSRLVDLPFQHVIYLLYAADHDLVIAAGTYNDPGCTYGHHAFAAADLAEAWSSDFYRGGTNTDHGEQDQHPCIVGNTMYGRYYKVDLRNGNTTSFALARGNCGTQSASATHLFGRNGNPYSYHLPGGSPIRMTTETRPGCWINMIPAGGLLLIPEASSGCACDYPLQATTVFVPK